MTEWRPDRRGGWLVLWKDSWAAILTATVGALLFLGCAGQNPGAPVASVEPAPSNPSDSSLIDCVVPGQIRRLDRKVTYVTAPQRIKASVADCENRGGSHQDPRAVSSSAD